MFAEALNERSEMWAAKLTRWTRFWAGVANQWLASTAFLPYLEVARRNCAVQSLSRQLLRALEIEVRAVGDRPEDGRPLLVVSNHISWLDSYVILALMPCRFVAKAEAFDWPVFGAILRGGGTIGITRGSARGAKSAAEEAAAALAHGERVAFFPEGTSTDGSNLLQFHPALFQSAIAAGTPVQPIALSYLRPDGTRTTSPAYCGDITLMQSIAGIVKEPAIVARVQFCDPMVPRQTTRRDLAREARLRIAIKLGMPDACLPGGERAPSGQASRLARTRAESRASSIGSDPRSRDSIESSFQGAQRND